MEQTPRQRDEARRAFWALNSLPARVRREGFGCWPSWFAGKSQRHLRRLARRRLGALAERFEGTELGALAGAAAEAKDARRGRQEWIGRALGVAGAALQEHPPCLANWHVRKEALLLLDFPLHARRGRRWREEIGRFYRQAMTRALDEIAEAPVERGLRIWKMYNMGFVVKSPEHCVGFDIHPGTRRTGPLAVAQQRQLAERLDAAFVSHLHFDHLHRGFLRLMLRSGKPVVLPPNRRGGLDHPNVVRPRAGHGRPIRVGGVEARCFDGWQRMLARNAVYVVALDGHRVLHNGDNTRHGVYFRLADVGDVDVMLANCWAGFGLWRHLTTARLLITGHENELSHAVSLRASFRYSYAKLARLGLAPVDGGGASPGRPECHVLSWGESIDWQPDQAGSPAPGG